MPRLTRSAAAPDAVLTRAVPFRLTRAEGDDAEPGRLLSGYAAVFDSPTRIDSWEGRFDEVIARGAFARTINASTPVVQFDHGHHPAIGSLPIAGPPTLSEDKRGLWVEAEMHKAELFEPVREAIASGAIKGMSFRFSVVKEEWDESDGREVPLRRITEVRLYELGPVVFPAYTDTSVGVRSDLDRLLADPETVARLAQILGTSPAPADEPATPDQDPLQVQHSGLTPEARTRALALLTPGGES